MKILIFCGPLAFGKGGMEKVAVNLANYLITIGHEVSVGFYARKKQQSPAYDLSSVIKLMPWDKDKLDFTRYRNQVLFADPDVFIAFGASRQLIEITALVYRSGIPLVIHEGSNPSRIINENWAQLAKIPLHRAAHEREAVLSAAVRIRHTIDRYKTQLPNVIQCKVRSFPNAFQQNEYYRGDLYSNGKNNRRIINIGGLKPNKNVLPLIKAFLAISEQYIDWELAIFSPVYNTAKGVHYANEIREFLSACDKNKRVKIYSETTDIDHEYRMSDIHVITSESEGLSSCVAESMTHGIPSIGYADCDGVSDLIKHQRDGFLVNNDTNVVSSLVNALNLLMGSTELRLSYGKQAHEASKKFDPEIVNMHWLALIDESAQYKNNVNYLLEQCESDRELSSHYSRYLCGLYRDLVGYTQPIHDVMHMKGHYLNKYFDYLSRESFSLEMKNKISCDMQACNYG